MSQEKITYSIAKGLRIRIAQDGNLYCSTSHSSGEFFLAPEILSLLCILEDKNILNKNTDLSSILKKRFNQITSSLPSEKECKNILKELEGSGIILKNEKQNRSLLTDGFADSWIQWAMLSDEVRCMSYYNALKESIKSDSVVLDVGAGCGYLSGASLSLGAKKVFAIEESAIAKRIEKFLKESGVKATSENFELFYKNSFDVKLPQNLNVVVSELFGNDPFEEGVLSTLADIAERLSHKNTKFIPEKVTVFFEFVNLKCNPALHRIKAFKNTTQKNKNFYENFLRSCQANLDLTDISFPLAMNEDDFERVSQQVELGSVSLLPDGLKSLMQEEIPFSGKNQMTITATDTIMMGLIWYRVNLVKNITISNHPKEKDFCVHWSPIAIPLNQILSVSDKVTIKHSLNSSLNHLHVEIMKDKVKIGGR